MDGYPCQAPIAHAQIDSQWARQSGIYAFEKTLPVGCGNGTDELVGRVKITEVRRGAWNIPEAQSQNNSPRRRKLAMGIETE